MVLLSIAGTCKSSLFPEKSLHEKNKLSIDVNFFGFLQSLGNIKLRRFIPSHLVSISSTFYKQLF